MRQLKRHTLAIVATALSLAGCHRSGSVPGGLAPQDLQRLPPNVRNSNMPDEAKKSMADELRRHDPNGAAEAAEVKKWYADHSR